MKKLIHITDLYQPHNDPDDHYDLAQVFALQKTGDIDVQQVIIDYPKQDDIWKPALVAVQQLNILTGKNVQVTVGADVHKFAGKPHLWSSASAEETHASKIILDIMKKSDEKVYICIAGGCLDTAIALEREPEVFGEKCAGIFLNAGSAIPTSEKEWNVTLGAMEYAKIFESPCPVYWNPCMHSMECWSGMYGTYYRFRQKDLWDKVSPQLVNYFLYALSRTMEHSTPEYLDKPIDKELLRKFELSYRDMYCTAGLFEIAGKTVTINGEIVPKEKTQQPVYSYCPVKINATKTGDTEWSFDDKSKDRFMFCVKDIEKYDEAMTKALTGILSYL